jgi:outer membrane protein assembly factor BamD (BamD/ComL family)
MQPLIQIHHWLGMLFSTVVFGAVAAWFLYAWLRRSEEPGLLVVKWVLTALIVGWLLWFVEAGQNTPMVFPHVIATLIGGLILAVLWRHNIAALIAKPFTSLYDGGSAEIEPQPYYSIAESKRKLGHYTEAVAEIRKQLERFPTDFTGQMMLAEIQAQNLNDLPGAELTIHRLVGQPGHTPRNVAHALHTLADWHLKYELDRDAAQRELERIVALFPETELALAAQQRIAHLASTEKMVAALEPKRYEVKPGIPNLGLRDPAPSTAELARADTEGVAADYVRHLGEHPLDFEVREKLALIYADHYRRLDLATDQLEQMIAAPGQPPKQVTRWLHLLADLQVRHGADLPTVQATLERILDQYPNTPAAQLARTRLAHLKLEFKGREKTGGLKLGTYEQNLGLKLGPRRND